MRQSGAGVLAAIILAVPLSAAAQPRCTGTEAYEGSPVHAPPSETDYPAPAAFDDAAFPAPAAEALKDAFERAVTANGALSLTAAVWAPGRGFWSARREADGVASHPLHSWASAGKMATAVAILQMADEDRLDLSDPVTRWRPDVPNGQWITVRRLLDHTSGLFSANEDPAARADPRYRNLDEQLEIVRRHGPLFCPGQAWRYTNTGYALLGSVIEAVDGRSYAEAAMARTFGRLGVAEARILTPEEAVPDIQPFGAPPPGEPRLDPSWPGAAGGVAATPQAMIRLLHGTLSGELLRRETVRSLLAQPRQMFGAPTWYGQGMMLYDVPAPQGDLFWIGHSGGAPGVKAVVVWSPARQAYAAVALTGDGSAEATANLLLAALNGGP
ncbi:serine hydrolase domain-containing protein [Brevundimonas sp.]|uniref:serine hydrolase domain-containing protein n=1 Tax=Brevundimonas sp. TaxID=1871086 RepID=UPI002FC66584